jgi:hypothetical protein
MPLFCKVKYNENTKNLPKQFSPLHDKVMVDDGNIIAERIKGFRSDPLILVCGLRLMRMRNLKPETITFFYYYKPNPMESFSSVICQGPS